MSAIFRRGDLYLSNRYKWVRSVPDLFLDWHVNVVLGIMLHPKQKQQPDTMAYVDESEPINLDTVQWIPI